MKTRYRIAGLLLLIAVVSVLGYCARRDSVERITQTREITLLTVNDANCYYTYRDRPMGLEYELAKAFSGFLGVRMRVIVSSWEDLYANLESGRGDFIGAGLASSRSKSHAVDWSDSYMLTEHHIVVHRDNEQIKKMENLNGRTIHVRRGSAHEETANGLIEKGFNISIQPMDKMPTEELIRMVADQEIEVTIADAHIAMLNRRYNPEIKISFPVGSPRALSWAVRKGERGLLKKINEFFEKIKEDGTLARIVDKYYGNLESFDYVDLRKYQERLAIRLPKYRSIMEKAGETCGFDWRLIAAMVYQESHFDPDAKSHTGVEGIMQLTQDTAVDMGIEDRRHVEQSIMGGVRYLKEIYTKFGRARNPDRMYLSLASYNVGRGHVEDAQRIAKGMGLDPNSWSAVEGVLPLLSHREYYKKTAFGYCRGSEPVKYVNRIRTYYDILIREAIS
jgi:membrane-bound lytic murein transglycosylase F